MERIETTIENPTSSSLKTAAFLSGTLFHHIDHIAPLASLLGVPILTNSEEVERQLQTLYPLTQVELWNDFQFCLHLGQLYDRLISCLTKEHACIQFNFIQLPYQKPLKTIWVPHGNSDKGRINFFGCKGLENEAHVTVYGQKMVDYIHESGVFSTIGKITVLGNFRYHYYLQHKSFYDSVVKDLLSPLPANNQTILYAPTWQDYENSSSFFDTFRYLIEELPEGVNLIFKVHPNLLLQGDQAIQTVKEAELLSLGKKNVLFLTDFPPIYPLLERVDIYLGDMSSIGYDFLLFKRPMFFFTKNYDTDIDLSKLHLHTCGTSIPITEYSRTYDVIKETLLKTPDLYAEEQNRLYTYTFGEKETEEEFEKRLKVFKQELLS